LILAFKLAGARTGILKDLDRLEEDVRLFLETGTDSKLGPPPGLAAIPTTDPSYNSLWADAKGANAQQPPGSGGVIKGTLVKAASPVTLYRIYNGPNQGGNNRIGQWWSTTKPSGSLQTYYKSNAVCGGDWNTNGEPWIVSCTVPAGTTLVTGPSQSVFGCRGYKMGSSFSIGISSTIQTFVNRERLGQIFGGCTSPGYRADPADLMRKATATEVIQTAANGANRFVNQNGSGWGNRASAIAKGIPQDQMTSSNSQKNSRDAATKAQMCQKTPTLRCCSDPNMPRCNY